VNGIFDAIPFGYTDGAALNTLNYGFYNTRDDIDPGYKLLGARLNGFSAFSDAQRAAARQAIETWDELIAVEFIETSRQGRHQLYEHHDGPDPGIGLPSLQLRRCLRHRRRRRRREPDPNLEPAVRRGEYG
jgi:hypothetical protein